MNVLADRVAGTLVRATSEVEREFEAGLSQWSTLAYRVAYSVLRHREDAEDVAQDVLVKAHRQLGQLRERDRLKAWLVRMAWRLALNRRESEVRRERREQVAVEPVSAPSSEDEALSTERSARLWLAIDRLPEKLRIVIVMASIQEHDLAQIAAALEIPEGTVKSRMFQARKQLREYLR